jgi:hypothetical protein
VSPHRYLASDELATQATVVGKMLEQMGLTVERKAVDADTFNRMTQPTELDRRGEQGWDIALYRNVSCGNFPPFDICRSVALDGPADWIDDSIGWREA